MPKEIQQRARFDIVRYANCWEDAELLCDALEPGPDKRFLSIASAGDNSFSILAHGAEVVAVDLSPAQLACVELRRAAFRKLDYPDLLRFFGVDDSSNRSRTFHQLVPTMPESAVAYWRANLQAIDSGFIHCGKFENYFHKFRTRVLPLVHSQKKIQQLLQPKTQDQRIEFYETDWNTCRWRTLFRIFFSRFVMGRLGRDPEFFRYVEGSVADRILDRTRHALTEIPTDQNPFLTYILTGNYGKALPHYLRAENFEAVRNGLNRLTLHQGTIQEAAEQFGATQRFDGYNLSDIFEYLDASLCEEVYGRLLDVANPGARFVYWNMLVPRKCPSMYASQVIRDEALDQQRLMRDQAWFYSDFVVEELLSSNA